MNSKTMKLDSCISTTLSSRNSTSKISKTWKRSGNRKERSERQKEKKRGTSGKRLKKSIGKNRRNGKIRRDSFKWSSKKRKGKRTGGLPTIKDWKRKSKGCIRK